MKRITLLLTILTFSLFNTIQAQSADYQATMQETVADIQEMKWGEDWQPHANKMERIASAEAKEWLPRYWAAYCYLNIAYAEPVAEKKDLILDKADKLMTEADSLNKSSDELEVLRANLASARMAADPMSRWQKYGPIATAAIEKAKKLNAENPRIYLHEAIGVMYTPEAFGGGKEKSIPLFKTTIEKFEKFKPSSDIMPNWGLTTAEYMKAQAEKK